jgi:type I restriction enzyme S subunit
LAHQDFIAHTLGILDSKISTNAAISKTLEDIAQTIFKSWFIDFDPVKAKMAGEKPVGMDASTAALFPDSMEESELGLIPKGWKAGTIGEICDSVVNGSTPLRTNSAYWSSDDISWFKTGELSDNFLFESKESITQLALEKTSVKVLPRGSVLMAIYAAPTVGRLGILTKSASFNQACTGMVAKNKFGTPYLYLTLFNRRFWFNSLAIGAAQQNISKVIVEGCPAITASQDVHNAFLKITEPIFTQIETLGRQSNSLALIRDSLLPRLISGELQIPDEMLAS